MAATTSLPATEVVARKSANYLPALALMRFTAVGGVIWTHACGQLAWTGKGFDFADAGRFGSAFFTQCSVFLVMLKAFGRQDLTWTANAKGRFFRVYVPFLLWSLIYALNMKFRYHVLHDNDDYLWEWAFFWNGSTYHLWFLPFIYVVGVILFAFARWIQKVPQAAIAIAVALLVAGVITSELHLTIYPDTFYWDYMFRLAWNRMPSVCWATSLAIIYQYGGREWLRTTPTLCSGLLLFTASVFLLGTQPKWHFFENTAGLGGMLVGLSILNSARVGWALPLGKLTYGMYLCHLLFLGFFRTVWHRFEYQSDNYGFAVVATILTIAFSAVASYFLARTKGLKILVPA